MGRDTIQLEDAVSTISGEYLLEFTSEYGIPEGLHPELPGPEETIVDFPEGKVGVYTKFFEFANYRIPLSQFLFDILGYYQIHLSQLSVIGAAKHWRERERLPTRVIDMEDVTEASKSSGIPSPVEKSPLDFADEDPLLVILEGVGIGGQARDEVSHEIPPVGNPPTTEVAPYLEPEAASIGSLARKRRREMGNGGADANAPPKVLRKDHASVRSEGIYQPGWGVTNSCRLDTPDACQDVVDHIVPPGYFSELRHMSNADFLGRYNINLAQQVAMGSQLRLRFEQEFSELQVDNNQLSQQVSNLQAQVTGEEKIKAAFEDFKKYEDDKVEQRCAEMDARLDALSIDFNEELYPHMLTAIAGRRWVIGHDIRLAVMKCAESTELRQVFANAVSAGIAKGMSEGLKHEVEHEKAKLDLAAIKAYDPEADAKYVAALHVLKDLKYPLVDQLDKLKDAPIDLIMTSLHLESVAGEDTPQWVRDLRPSSSQLKIPVYPEVSNPRDPLAFKEEILSEDAIATNISRAEKKKKKCRVVCRTHGVGSAHHARSNGVPVSVPTVAPQGLAILLADAATQTKTSEDEASPRLIRSKSLLPMYNLNGP
ncbi:hypothetical protein Tco_0549458 [Tanacetum coccineum]